MVPSGREIVQIQSTNAHNQVVWGSGRGARKPHFLLLQGGSQSVTLNYDTLNVPATGHTCLLCQCPRREEKPDEGEIALGNAVPAQM